MNKSTAIFGGAGLGILIGLLIGMSTSGTVGLIIGSLASFLLVLLGFKEKGDSNSQTLRVGSFGLFCSLAIIIGLFFRVNNSFTPTLKSEIEMWTADSIFSMDEAKAFVLYERFGFVPSGVKVDSTIDRKRAQSVLYGTKVSISDCEKTQGYKDKDFPIQNELNAYKRLGGVWEKIANAIEKEVDIDNQKTTLHIFQQCLCNNN
ncbi:hypothetical protein ACFFU1_08205 [Algibacter miyuki]|uniref:DUF4190 domain-containing protein n=1 Tax=Algibacter miyuki TaxID=1306933 RepID=A0ABV5GYZ9_9FLAO|nr:hypothetical protein [Algibacter miyuki]MDN3666924.1 hypothetical protein [Algibacter miyuki]